MKIAYFYITKQGRILAERLQKERPGTLFGKEDLKENMKMAFQEYDGLVCIMAAGIVVRILAPLFVHKKSDPAVVVMDARGKYAVSLLSGHLGGANQLARELAEISKGEAVITTATDVEGTFAVDIFAREEQLMIENIDAVKYLSAALLDGRKIRLQTPYDYPALCREEIVSYPADGEGPVLVIDEKIYQLEENHILYLRPKNLHVGIGCKYGMAGEKIIEAVQKVFEKYQYSPLSIAQIATIPKKAGEKGVREAADYFKVPICTVLPQEIAELDFDKLKIKQSDFVKKTIGVPSVSTASAYIASGGGTILIDKEIFPGITVSIARNRQENKKNIKKV